MNYNIKIPEDKLEESENRTVESPLKRIPLHLQNEKYAQNLLLEFKNAAK